MKITKENIKETLRSIMKEESEYQVFFRKALEKAGKSITNMSDDEKKAFFNKIDAAWDGKGEKNEELVGNQHKLDVDGDGEIEASDLAALRAKKDESVNEEEIKWNAVENAIINFLKMNTKILDKRVKDRDTDGVKGGLKSIISGLTNAQRNLKLESVNEALLPADTKVVKSFFDNKPLEGRNLNTDGKVLKTAGIGSQEMYIHTPKGVKMVGKITGKYAQSLVQFVNKNYKTDLVESINEGRAFINAARKAKQEGKTEFEFNGKKYPVTIK